MNAPPFLTAEWRHLVLLNYAVDADILQPLVPRGTSLDWHDGATYISIVGFRFLRTRVFGIAIPSHTSFEEVNLRFYVRRSLDTGPRRGVVFIREIVPRRAVAFTARAGYGEPYIALPMSHEIVTAGACISARYKWLLHGKWNEVAASAGGPAGYAEPDSDEEFITEHYWGYTKRGSSTTEYNVQHPRWRLWKAEEANLDCDAAALYGERFATALSGPPTSAFIAEGSAVRVEYPVRVA